MKHNNNTNTPESEKDCAQTPWWFVRSLESFLGMGMFDLDPCAGPETSKAPNNYCFNNGEDGLKSPWSLLNYVNPPFSDILPWLNKAEVEADRGCFSAVLMPDNPETKYVRRASLMADTIIRMPFRLSFLKPDGTEFLDKKGKKQGPQFPCVVAFYTPIGLRLPTRFIYHDFKIGFV